MSSTVIKKQKACLHCRRAKLRCIVIPNKDSINGEQDSCERCLQKGEKCRFRLRAHDDLTQANTNLRLTNIEQSIQYLLSSIQSIASSLQLQLPPQPLPSRLEDLDDDDQLSSIIQQPIQQQASTSNTSTPKRTKRQLPPSNNNHHPDEINTPRGVDALLNRSILNPSSSSSNYLPPPPPLQHHHQQHQQQQHQHHHQPNPDYNQPSEKRFKPSSSSSSESIISISIPGSLDPRLDVIKAGIVKPELAQLLLEFFHHHLAPNLLGFPFQPSAWPFLEQGSATITPLVLGVICLLSSSRIPQHTNLIAPLERFLLDSVLMVQPGKFHTLTRNHQNGQEALELDLEAGIGPEEIAALCLYATFSNSSRSNVIAQVAFEWTRGYLKTYMEPAPPLPTMGECLGILTARRDLRFENWLRLWLFAYVINGYQSFHRLDESLPSSLSHDSSSSNIPSTSFDPIYYCETLSSNLDQQISPVEQTRDRELIAHARLCALIESFQSIRSSNAWNGLNRDAMEFEFREVDRKIDQWYFNTFPPLSSNTGSGSTSFSSSSNGGKEIVLSAASQLALNLFGLFTRMFFAFTATQEPILLSSSTTNSSSSSSANSSSETIQRFSAVASRCARDLLRTVLQSENNHDNSSSNHNVNGNGNGGGGNTPLAFLLPFYWKMIDLAVAVLLEINSSTTAPSDCDLIQAVSEIVFPENISNSRLVLALDKMRLLYLP